MTNEFDKNHASIAMRTLYKQADYLEDAKRVGDDFLRKEVEANSLINGVINENMDKVINDSLIMGGIGALAGPALVAAGVKKNIFPKDQIPAAYGLGVLTGGGIGVHIGSSSPVVSIQEDKTLKKHIAELHSKMDAAETARRQAIESFNRLNGGKLDEDLALTRDYANMPLYTEDADGLRKKIYDSYLKSNQG